MHLCNDVAHWFVLGDKIPEIVVEVLEAFGRALKVCFTYIKIFRVLCGEATMLHKITSIIQDFQIT